MSSIIRVKGLLYNGCTMSEVLNQLASDPNNTLFKDQPLIIQINGKLVIASDYDHVLINANDEIIIMPLMAGG